MRRHTRRRMTVPVDQRGHAHLPSDTLSRGGDNLGQTMTIELTTFGDRPPHRGYVSAEEASPCRWCDAHPQFTYDGEKAVAATACPLPDGTEIVFNLHVPSGRVIVSDSLHPVYDIGWERAVAGRPGYNSVAGQALYSQQMAAIGCAYGPVLNDDPSLIQVADGRYVIACLDEDAEPGQEHHLDGQRLATIRTALWAYSIADYDDWLTRLRSWRTTATPGPRYRSLIDWFDEGAALTALPLGYAAVALPSGTYRFTHHGGVRGFDMTASPLIYADIEKIR